MWLGYVQCGPRQEQLSTTSRSAADFYPAINTRLNLTQDQLLVTSTGQMWELNTLKYGTETSSTLRRWSSA